MSAVDVSFRPETYWPDSLTPEQRLSCIRGKQRQDIARQLYKESGFTALNEFLVRDGLTEEERCAWGAVAPACMGGEYLPELDEGEVEIARISMASTTSDQISVRARPEGERIRYRIVGEYEEDESMRQQLPVDITDQPLTLDELMDMIEGASAGESPYPGGIFSSSWAMMLESGESPEEIERFLSVSSAFYPQIGERYHALALQWLEECWESDDEDGSELIPNGRS